jgi:hypothetical protein
VALGAKLPDCEAAVFPQLLGEAYRRAGPPALTLPLLIITSEFGNALNVGLGTHQLS